MKELVTLDHLFTQHPDLSGKVVLVRVDLNVPIQQGKIIDKTRIESVIPTIESLLERNARVALLSHYGRPKGVFERSLSLAPITDAVDELLPEYKVSFGLDCVGKLASEAIEGLQDREVLLLENVRFHEGEESNDKDFVKELSSLGDIYVNDTLSSSHRSHASVVGITDHLPSYAGLCLQAEIENLNKVWSNAESPISVIVGGSKISTKIGLLEHLVEKVDNVIVGGALANTFLAAEGNQVGTSLYEKDKLSVAKSILAKAKTEGCKILLPLDGVCVESLESSEVEIADADSIPSDKMMVDVGPKTVNAISDILSDSKTVIWNGPLGAFEYGTNHVGSVSIARAIAGLTASNGLTSVAGGGDVLAAIKKAGLQQSFTYVSTAGGAFLEWIEGKDLPGVSVLYSQKVEAA